MAKHCRADKFSIDKDGSLFECRPADGEDVVACEGFAAGMWCGKDEAKRLITGTHRRIDADKPLKNDLQARFLKDFPQRSLMQRLILFQMSAREVPAFTVLLFRLLNQEDTACFLNNCAYMD